MPTLYSLLNTSKKSITQKLKLEKIVTLTFEDLCWFKPNCVIFKLNAPWIFQEQSCNSSWNRELKFQSLGSYNKQAVSLSTRITQQGGVRLLTHHNMPNEIWEYALHCITRAHRFGLFTVSVFPLQDILTTTEKGHP